MGALLFFGFPLILALLGWIIELFDKQKEDKRQDEITEKAKFNLLRKCYLKQGSYKREISLVKLEDFRWCYLQRNGSALNNAQLYFSAEEFDEKTVIVGLVGGGYNIMNTSGRYLLPVLCDNKKSYYIKRIISGFYSVSIRTEVSKNCCSYEYHVYNEDGVRLNLNPLSSEATYSDGWFTIKIGDKETRMNKNGKQETPFFKSKESIGDSLFIVSEDSSYVFGLYDAKKNKMILPCVYESLFYHKDLQICIVRVRTKEGKWEKGKCVMKPEFCYRIIELTGKIIYESKDNLCSIVDGKYISTCAFREGSKPSAGAISFNGDVIFDPIYHKIIVNDSGTLFFALSDNQCYVSDRSGKVISKYNFKIDEFRMDDTLTIYKHIYPSVYIDNGKGVIGKRTSTSTYSTRDIAIIIRSSEGKKGILSLENEVIIPALYDSFKQIDNENDVPIAVIAEKNRLFGVISLTGEIIVPIRYSSISYDYENSESYVPLHDVFESNNFYDDMEELEHWENWKAGRTRLLVIRDKNGNVIRRCVIDGNKFCNIQNEQVVKKADRDAVPLDSPNKQSINSVKKVKKLTKYLFFDTETIGLPKNYKAPSSDLSNWPRIVQLSWLLVDDQNRTLAQGDYIIKPTGFTIPETSVAIHGITNKIALENGVDLSVAISRFIEDYKQCDLIVGHNINFDRKVLGAEMIRIGMNDLLKRKRSICTMLLSTDLCKIPGKQGYKYPKLQELHEELFGKGFDNAHNSAADVEATRICFFEMKKRGLLEN